MLQNNKKEVTATFSFKSAHAQCLMPSKANLLPILKPLHLCTWLAEELHLHLLELTHTEYDKFKERTKNNLSPVEIHFLENFEREQKRLMGGKLSSDY